jgi:hypothetical protein
VCPRKSPRDAQATKAHIAASDLLFAFELYAGPKLFNHVLVFLPSAIGKSGHRPASQTFVVCQYSYHGTYSGVPFSYQLDDQGTSTGTSSAVCPSLWRSWCEASSSARPILHVTESELFASLVGEGLREQDASCTIRKIRFQDFTDGQFLALGVDGPPIVVDMLDKPRICSIRLLWNLIGR